MPHLQYYHFVATFSFFFFVSLRQTLCRDRENTSSPSPSLLLQQATPRWPCFSWERTINRAAMAAAYVFLGTADRERRMLTSLVPVCWDSLIKNLLNSLNLWHSVLSTSSVPFYLPVLIDACDFIEIMFTESSPRSANTHRFQGKFDKHWHRYRCASKKTSKANERPKMSPKSAAAQSVFWQLRLRVHGPRLRHIPIPHFFLSLPAFHTHLQHRCLLCVSFVSPACSLAQMRSWHWFRSSCLRGESGRNSTANPLILSEPCKIQQLRNVK